MDARAILRLDTLIRQIKTSLLMNEDLRTLLFSGESTTVPSIEAVQDAIFLHPVVDVATDAVFERKNFISITAPLGGKELEQGVAHTIQVTVQCEKTQWMVDFQGEKRVRPLVMMQEIINSLDNEKLCMSGSLEYEEFQQSRTNQRIYGYSIFFSVLDGVAAPQGVDTFDNEY